MTHGSLFSGEGGFDLAAERAGWQNAFHCEINPFPSKILNYYWPNATAYTDITKTDFTEWRGKIDVLTGGFPCQSYSLAGKRLGTADTRHLWPQMLRAVREIRPRWVVGENVRGLINWDGGLVFDQVQSDLEAEGYTVIPFLLPACGVNAPHRRERIWFVAHSNKCAERSSGKSESTESNRCKNNDEQELRRVQAKQHTGCDDVLRYVADTIIINTGIQVNRWCNEKTLIRTAGYDKPSAWQNFPTQSPVCGGDDGLPAELDGITFPKWRGESIKAHGNAIVPEVAFQIFETIDLFEMLY